MNHYVLSPVMMVLQPFNPLFRSKPLSKVGDIGRYNVEKEAAKRHALKKAKSMKEHIGLLRLEAEDTASALHTEPRHSFFRRQATEKPKPPLKPHHSESMLIHLDSIVAHHEGQSTGLPNDEVPETETFGSCCLRPF